MRLVPYSRELIKSAQFGVWGACNSSISFQLRELYCVAFTANISLTAVVNVDGPEISTQRLGTQCQRIRIPELAASCRKR